MMYESLVYALIGTGVLALVFTLIPLVTLNKLYKVSKPNHLRIAGRSYNSFNQLQRNIGLGCRLWRNPELIESADPRQQRYLESIRRWAMAVLFAWVSFALAVVLALISIVEAVGE